MLKQKRTEVKDYLSVVFSFCPRIFRLYGDHFCRWDAIVGLCAMWCVSVGILLRFILENESLVIDFLEL